jgi:predicted phosphodiesterase
MRIGLIGDSHGYTPALEAALAACRAAAVDVTVHCGDVITCPFSPDPVAESIALLRAAGVPTVVGNHDMIVRAWDTPEWEAMVALRMVRGYPIGEWVQRVGDGQARLAADDLAWLRTLPMELLLSGHRQDDVYVCHALPGNPFISVDGGDAREHGVTPQMRDAAFALPGPGAADLVLTGHSHVPATFHRDEQVVVRTGAAIGWDVPPGEEERPCGYAIATLRADGWEVEHRVATWRPRDPHWSWRTSLEQAGP